MYGLRPSDEELLKYYLTHKTLDNTFSVPFITDADLTQLEPWDLPGKANTGDREWYFFHKRGQRYAKGPRVKRSTKGGFWKQSGYDQEIFDSQTKVPIGKKKKLVFYTGRHTHSEKTKWIMDEYNLGGQFSDNLLYPNMKEEWVLCKVFERNEDPKKSQSGQKRKFAVLDQPEVSSLPSLSNATNSSSEFSCIITTSINDEKATCSMCNNADMFSAISNDKAMTTDFGHLYVNCLNSFFNLEGDQKLPFLPLQEFSEMLLPSTHLGGFDIPGLQANFESTQCFSNGNQQEQNSIAVANDISDSSLVEPYSSYTSLLLMESPVTDFGFHEKESNDITCLGNNHDSFQWVSDCYNHQQEGINAENWDAFNERVFGARNTEQVDDAQTLSILMGENLAGGPISNFSSSIQ